MKKKNQESKSFYFILQVNIYIVIILGQKCFKK